MKLEEMINKVTCGDCLPILKSLPDKCIDLVLTDPPYGISYNNDDLARKSNASYADKTIMANWTIRL